VSASRKKHRLPSRGIAAKSDEHEMIPFARRGAGRSTLRAACVTRAERPRLPPYAERGAQGARPCEGRPRAGRKAERRSASRATPWSTERRCALRTSTQQFEATDVINRQGPSPRIAYGTLAHAQRGPTPVS
jgi:hypothetical protein